MKLPPLAGAEEKTHYHACVKVGFSPRQANALADINTWDVDKFIRVGFTRHQAKAIIAANGDVPTLIQQAHFTRQQAELVNAIFNG